MRRIRCSEIWGGNGDADTDVCTAGITASLFSQSADGGRGGDIYYISVCGGDMLTRIAVADVVGHGSAVSDVSGWLYDGMTERMSDSEGNRILGDMNGIACKKGFKAITTAVVIGFYLAESRLYAAYAGHPPALVSRDGHWQPFIVDTSATAHNFPLGIDSAARYDQDSQALQSGDALLVYTDGVIEAQNNDGIGFGEDRLTAVLNNIADPSPFAVKQQVLESVREHTAGNLGHDDVTLLAIQIN